MITSDQLQCIDFQFITQGDHIQSALAALDGGCKWIQLRMKTEDTSTKLKIAEEIVALCHKYDAVCIIDDDVALCNEVKADGIHLGKDDMSPKEALQILEFEGIMGLTCNTFEDVEFASNFADYIGLGPFRFTQTKKNLSPILGLEGYKDIMNNCKNNNITTPITAIGGITIADIPDLLATGVNSIAVSGLIANSENPVETTKEIVKIIHQIKQS